MTRHPPSTDDLQHELSQQRERERQAARESIERGDEPWHHETGVVAATDAVRDVQFPMSNEDLAALVGDRYIQASDRLTLPLAEILAHIPETEFVSIRQFERAVQKHWAAIRFLEVPDEQRSPRGGRAPKRGKR